MTAPSGFLRRWSQRKHESRAAVPAPTAPREAPALPPLESIGPDSDIAAFMQAKVDEAVKRAALRKLFSDPRFNVMDGLDIYIGDYTAEDPIPATMLAGLEHARATLFRPDAGEEKETTAQEGGEPDAAA